jgi:hypothetical protein
MVLVYILQDKGKRFTIVDPSVQHFGSKILPPSNRFKINSPVSRTDAVIRKYGDTSARCTSFGPYFNNGNQNPFYIELTKTYDYYCECLRNQTSKTVEIYGGRRTPPAHSMQIPKSGKYNGKQYIIVYTAISIKVVHEQSGKVEYERERLLGTALKFH